MFDLIYTKWENFESSFRRRSQNTQGIIICAAVLLITVIRSGITYSFGVFIVKLQNTYHVPMAVQNWIGTLSFTISLACAPASVLAIRLMGPQGYRISGFLGVIILTVSCMGSSLVTKEEWMFFTHSLLYGIGSSFLLMSSSLIIGEYFDQSHPRHVLATSILLCGYPLGSLIFNPLNGWCVSAYGWRVAFRLSGTLVFATGIVCCSLYIPKSEQAEDSDSEVDIDKALSEIKGSLVTRLCASCRPHQLFSRPEIVLWLFGNMLSFICFYMPFVNLAFYMKLKNITIEQSSWALTVLSLCECATYIFAACFGDFLKGRLIWINIFAAIGLSVLCFVWPSIDVDYSAILGASAVLGAFLGLTIVYQYAVSGEVTKLSMDIAWPATNMWSGLGIMLGPLFSGAVYDARKSYDDVFYVCGAMYLVQVFIFSGIPICSLWRSGMGTVADYDELDGDTKETVHPPETGPPEAAVPLTQQQKAPPPPPPPPLAPLAATSPRPPLPERAAEIARSEDYYY